MPRSNFLRTPLLHGNDPELKREEIRRYFHATLDCYEELFETLRSDEAYYNKPISLRHPLIFYFGHTATFFINKLILAGLLSERINPKLESMFAVGVDEMSWDDLDSTHYNWPTVQEVRDYRNTMRQGVDQLITQMPLVLPITWESSWWPILMGVEHERIHLETSSVLIRQHALKYVRPHPNWQPCLKAGKSPENQMIAVSSGSVTLDKNKQNHQYYGWDNEYGLHQGDVAAFQASRYLVTNQEFLHFIVFHGSFC